MFFRIGVLIPITLILSFFNNLECENSDILFNIAIKKLGNKEKTRENLDKVYRFLISRGFDYDEVGQTIKRLKEEE